MQSINFDEVIETIQRQDPRYSREAYHFVREALDFTQRQVHRDERSNASENRHVSGRQLLEGIRDYALSALGPMALFTLQDWGICRCEDIGDIVFNLVDHGKGMFGKTESDSREDFKGGYDFHATFRQPFLPTKRSIRPAARDARSMNQNCTD
jgi:uncharacterized repeat protein (TIGR04138 family)